MMDLSDVLYIIEGSLEVGMLDVTGPKKELCYEAVLYDTVHDPCVVQFVGKPRVDARARGWHTEKAALDELVLMLAGGVIGHCIPVLFETSLEWTRIPPTLVAGTPRYSLPAALFEEDFPPEPPAA